VDAFQEHLEDHPEYYLKELQEFLEGEDIPDEVLEQIASDPECYTLKGVNDPGGGYGRRGLWEFEVGTIYEQRDGARYDEDLKEIVKRMNDADIAYVIEFLAEHEPYVTITTHDRFETGYDYQWDSDIYFVANFNEKKIRERIAELTGEGVEQVPDEVVYTYPATWDSITGPDAKGFYVARLRAGQLSAEGRALGICVGTERYGYKQRVKEGSIDIFSIRTGEGKSKFTIERDLEQHFEDDDWRIVQVKGKANRLPGFDAGKDTLTKPLEVRLVVEFLLSLGLPPEGVEHVRDVQPGVLALKAQGIDPFAPPSRPAKKVRANPNARVARLARAAYAQPWGSELRPKRP
jgi:hypothetical protein